MGVSLGIVGGGFHALYVLTYICTSTFVLSWKEICIPSVYIALKQDWSSTYSLCNWHVFIYRTEYLYSAIAIHLICARGVSLQLRICI